MMQAGVFSLLKYDCTFIITRKFANGPVKIADACVFSFVKTKYKPPPR